MSEAVAVGAVGAPTVAPTIASSRKSRKRASSLGIVVLVMMFAAFSMMIGSMSVVGQADNFTDIFYTNSFRGAFVWIQKLDWVGMIVQMVISCFSLFGVALMTIRIMTSLLFLSSKGLWEEVHDLKSSIGGGESELYDLGLVNLAKSWAKGKAGTGLDAIIGAILIILPDVKKYSDFGEKANGEFDENMSVSQYMLKIAIPTVMTVFFFAMGFNGTLFEAIAVTVDAMGTAADKAISVNYAGFVEDLVNSGNGYKFAFSAAGTNLGTFRQNIAKDLYGRLVTELDNEDAEQLEILGKNVETKVQAINYTSIANNGYLSEKVKAGLTGTVVEDEDEDEDEAALLADGDTSEESDETEGDDSYNATADSYVTYLGYEIVENNSSTVTGAYASWEVNSTFFTGVPRLSSAQSKGKYIHLFIKQDSSFNGTYFNLDGTVANN